MRDSDLRHAKPWRLRRIATEKRKALAHCRSSARVAYREHMIECMETDLAQIAAELERRKGEQA